MLPTVPLMSWSLEMAGSTTAGVTFWMKLNSKVIMFHVAVVLMTKTEEHYLTSVMITYLKSAIWKSMEETTRYSSAQGVCLHNKPTNAAIYLKNRPEVYILQWNLPPIPDGSTLFPNTCLGFVTTSFVQIIVLFTCLPVWTNKAHLFIYFETTL